MTSANIPGEPMLTKNEEAFSLNADIYLLHNRKIPNRIDDTVLRTWNNNIFFIRKSRGFVPEPISVPYKNRVLSVGADENITGTISNDGNIYSTQYIGNSKYYSTLEFLEESLHHLMTLTMKKPSLDAVVRDIHPGYDSRKTAQKFADEFNTPIYDIQHDWSHAASLLLDNNVDSSIVIAIEGLGYGTDGTFWGGEVLNANFLNFDRIGHLEYIPLLGGDKATIDPRRLVFAIFKRYEKIKYFFANEVNILTKLMDKSPLSCSLGRYLDAISSYLGICSKMTYSGEPAMKLEKYLALGKDVYDLDVEIKNNVVQVVDLFNQIDDIVKPPFSEKDKANISFSLVKAIVTGLTDIAISYALDKKIKTIGVSGGVSYNAPINEMISKIVNDAGLKLLVHNKIPNGDGGISVGQNVIVGNIIN